ncbi:MAG: ribosomal RNA small subunit methyltransferase A [Chloroflexi bacterium]|nr:ribosomal RNA small subunit methyltransferase A [Chloroflexota bacterium]
MTAAPDRSPQAAAGGQPPRPTPGRELRALGRAAKKSLGQHFLRDRAAVAKIVAAADLGPEDTVVEVGPGLGVLTEALVQGAGRVIAVELDAELAAALRRKLGDRPNLEVVVGDILALQPAALLQRPGEAGVPPYKVVANLPYYITSAVLRHFLEARPRPRLMVVMVQREVARSMVAGPGEMGILAVSVQLYGRPRIVATVPPGSFYPPPKVESAVVRIDVAPEPVVAIPDEETFFQVVRAGFSARRKQLHNTLAHGLGLPDSHARSLLAAVGIDPARRPQTLTLEEWAALARGYAALRPAQDAGQEPSDG